MSKTKPSSKAAKPAKPDVLTQVKDAAITKPAQKVKAVGKELAKQVVGKEEKKSKKKAKEPTPEPSDSEDSDSSASSASSSDSEAEAKPKKAAVNGKVNGKTNGAKASKKDESDSDADSDSDSSDSEAEAPKAKKSSKPAVAPKGKVEKSSESEASDDSDDDSDESMADAEPAAKEDSDADSSDDSSDDEKPTKKVAAKAAAVKDAAKDDSASSDSDDSSDDSDKEASAPKSAKRKAVDEPEQTPKKAKTDSVDTSKGGNLFVGNLSWNVDEAWLKEVFEEFGELSGTRIVTSREDGRSRGFGYVEFVNAEDAAKAHAAKNGADLDGRPLNVDFANARTEGPQKQETRRKSYGDQISEPSDTLFVGNLSFEVGQETVTEYFAPHGTILGIRLPTDRETGEPKGFGYVTFASADEAKVAMDAMQGSYIEGRPIRLDFSSPRPQNSDSPARGRGGFGGRGAGRGGRGGRGGFGDRGGRGGRGGFGGRGGRGGRGGSTNRGGFGDFSGKKTSFD